MPTLIFLKSCNICRKLSMTEFTVKEVTVCRVAIFLKEALHHMDFLGIYEIFSITNSSNLNC